MFEMYVNVVFVRRGLYSAVSLTLVREQRFIRIIIIIIIIITIIIISNDFGFICAGVSNVAVIKETPDMIITKSELSITICLSVCRSVSPCLFLFVCLSACQSPTDIN